MELFGNYAWGEPWRYSDRALGVVVPILRVTRGRRAYVTMEEVKDKVDITDSGHIGEVHVKSRADKPVFIRGGTLLKGGGTQSRVVTCGTVIMPEEEQEIKRGQVVTPEPAPVKVPVACVHSSHPIFSGSTFTSSGFAPRYMASALSGYSTNQGEVWGNVLSATAEMRLRYPEMTSFHIGENIASNDLVKNIELVDCVKKEIEDIVKTMPKAENQVGMVIFDDKGVVGFEAYDHPDSWDSLVKFIMKSYSDVLGKEDKEGLFELKLERLEGLAKGFAEKLKARKDGAIIFESGEAKTVSFTAEGVVGEYTVLGREVIHAVATRVEKTEKPKFSPMGTGSVNWYSEPDMTWQPYPPTTNWTCTGFTGYTAGTSTLGGLTSDSVINYLNTKPRSFTDVRRNFDKSKPTTSKHLKEGIAEGLIAKTEDGYQLTALGLYLRKQKG